MKIALVSLLLLLSSCAARKPVKVSEPVYRNGYAYFYVNESKVLIAADSSQFLQAAQDEICKKQKRVCTVRKGPDLYVIEILGKGNK